MRLGECLESFIVYWKVCIYAFMLHAFVKWLLNCPNPCYPPPPRRLDTQSTSCCCCRCHRCHRRSYWLGARWTWLPPTKSAGKSPFAILVSLSNRVNIRSQLDIFQVGGNWATYGFPWFLKFFFIKKICNSNSVCVNNHCLFYPVVWSPNFFLHHALSLIFNHY